MPSLNRVRQTLKPVRHLRRVWSSRFRVLPRVLVIGVQKGGTTSLYNYLMQHPSALPSRVKEPRFFGANYHRGEAWYRLNFPYAWQAATPEALVVDASAGTIYHPLAPERVDHHISDPKIVVLLRDPVERAWSHYHHTRRLEAGAHEPLPFREAVWREAERLASFHRTYARDPLHYAPEVSRYTYLSRGLYARQLRRWLERFSRERLLVLRSKDLFDDPEPVMEATFEFLGLDAVDAQRFRIHNAGSNKGDTVPPGIRAELKSFFRPHNEDLYALLGRDFGW